MGALELLERVRELDQLWRLKRDERTRLWAMATDISAKPSDGMPYSGGGTGARKLETAVEKIIAIEQEISEVIDEYLRYQIYAAELLEKLPLREYGVLHRYYLQGMTWEKVAESVNFSVVHVWRIKKRGIAMLDAIMNEIEKESQNDKD